MCGIFGYIGAQNAIEVVLAGLKKIEYRGYDSAGIAGIHEGTIGICKEEGKISVLEEKVHASHLALDSAIGHTRWATHGKPSLVNAHPHFDAAKSVAVVHNGIIENHQALRKKLQDQGVTFVSETDTEVIPHLIAHHFRGDLLEAVHQAVMELEGAFALAIIHKDFPEQIIAVANESPLAIGISANEAFISSDSHAFSSFTRDVLFLSHAEIAVIGRGHYEVYDENRETIDRKLEKIEARPEASLKGEYSHYTLKEIFEQPHVLKQALKGRVNDDFGTAQFDELKLDGNDLSSVERILILGCGTSWHAGFLAEYMLEDIARIPVQVEISSEYRYKNPIVPSGTFVIAISQSGETADTLAATRELQAKGAKVLALCNTKGSTLDRESDACIYLRAGTEVGVCSTKAFTNQVAILFLFTIMLARTRHLSADEGKAYLQALKLLPQHIQEVLDRASHIEKIAKRFAKYDNFFFLGRSYMYPTCLEGALKLKEISYINANAYPAGEMKHGPIALINEQCPTVAFCANEQTFGKMVNNLMEVKARLGPIIAIAEEEVENVADHMILVPKTLDPLSSIPSSVAAQLFAYFVAKERGADIDQPRNLAKSVTVE